jgi:hypothetical protein
MLGRVVDFQSAGQASDLFRRERFVKRGRVMGVEIIQDEANFGSLEVAFIEHAFDEKSPVCAAAMFGDGDVPGPPKGSTFRKISAIPLRTYS